MKKSISEKYKLVLEGNYSIEQFKKDCIYELPHYITPVNSFSDIIKILENKNIIHENKIGSDILGWFYKKYPQYKVKLSNFGDKKTILDFENGKELPHEIYQQLEDMYSIFENDESDEFTDYHKYTYTIEPIEIVHNKFDFDRTGGESKYNVMPTPSILNGPLNEGKKKEKILTPDEVNYYEYQRGLRYELEKGKNPEKAQKDVLKNLTKDPIYYNRLLAGEKPLKKSKKDDIGIDISKAKSSKDFKDIENEIKPLKGAKKIKDNVKDTLGKKEAVKSSPKGIKQQTMTPQKQKGVKVMEVPKTKGKTISLKESKEYKYLKLKDSLKKLIKECMCELGMDETVNIPSYDKEIYGEPDVFTPFAQTVKTYLDTTFPDEEFFINRYGDDDNSYEDNVLLTYNYWEKIPDSMFEQISSKFNISEENDLDELSRFYYMIKQK